VSGLAQIAQDDFSAGMLQGTANDVQAGVGANRILNGLISDDGDVVRRGATIRFLSHTGGSMRPITWVWSGVLADTTIVLYSTDQGDLYWTPNGTPTLLAAGAGVFAPVQAAVIGSTLFLPNGKSVTRTAGSGGTMAVASWSNPVPSTAPLHIATIAGRLVAAAGNRIHFSAPLGVGVSAPVFAADDFHTLPGGVEIRGVYAIADTLMVFTNHGVWTVANMAYDLTDAAGNIQQALSLLLPELSLPVEGGLCGWQGRVVAVFTDRVAIVDPVNPPVVVSNSISTQLAFYASGGLVAGGIKVFRDILFLPIVSDPMAANWGTVLTCRLNRPVQGRQLYYPWTEFDGHAGSQLAFDVYSQQGYGTTLVGGGNDGQLADFGGVLDDPGRAGADADGVAFKVEIETRHLPTGQGQPNHLKRIRVRYTAVSSYTGTPALTVAYNPSSDPTDTTSWVSLGSQPLSKPGKDPVSWWLPVPARVRYVRVRLTLTDTSLETFTVQRVELDVRAAAHAR
jgi:hypothetical protein